MPIAFSVIGTVSRISVRSETLPLYFGSYRSLIESTPGARSSRTISPVMPLCHGTVNARFGSAAGCLSAGIMLRFTLGSCE